jgi:hypothetical protein
MLRAACPAEKLAALEGHVLQLDAIFDDLQGLFADDSVACDIVTKWRSMPGALVDEDLVDDSRNEILDQLAITKEESMLALFSSPNKTDATCASVLLRLLRNEPTLTELDFERFAKDLPSSRWSYPMLRALHNNTNVSRFRFRWHKRNPKHTELLIDCIRQSTALRELEIEDFESYDEGILRAIADSPFVEKLWISDTCYLLGEEIVHLLQTTASIISLRLPLYAINHDSVLEVAEALRTSRTLQDLSVSLQWASARSAEILSYLEPHPFLRTVDVIPERSYASNAVVTNDVVESACSFLSGSRSLCHLALADMNFSGSDMARFIKSCSESEHLSKLTLSNCSFGGQAGTQFVDFLKTTNGIEDLYFSSPRDGWIAVQLATIPTSLRALHILTLSGGLLGSLIRCAPEIRLRRLSIQGAHWNYNWHGTHLLDRFISGLVSLCELEIVAHTLYKSDLPSTSLFLAAMKQNSCLQQVSLPWTYGTCGSNENAWNQLEENLLRAYCQRNQTLRMLLGATNDQAGIALLPMLLTAARQSPKAGPNSIFMCLLHRNGTVDSPNF